MIEREREMKESMFSTSENHVQTSSEKFGVTVSFCLVESHSQKWPFPMNVPKYFWLDFCCPLPKGDVPSRWYVKYRVDTARREASFYKPSN